MALAVPLLVVALGLGLVVSSSAEATLGPYLPSSIAFPLHAVVGLTLNRLRLEPSWAAVQWLKAAAHARSSADEAVAANGIASSVRQSPPNEHLELVVCDLFDHGSPTVQMIVVQAGIQCSHDLVDRRTVAIGAFIQYQTRPPVAGPHYPSSYPSYGVVTKPVAPGYWVHNLEDGAIVLLYNCPLGCTDALEAIRRSIGTLPLGHNPLNGYPRMLVVVYADMDHRFAVVAWGHLLELDQLDWGQVATFYNTYIDRGPECHNFVCPP